MSAPPYLVDTNILLRIARRDDPDHSTVRAALLALVQAGASLHYTHQNIAEFWNVATRPANRNGFGLTVAETLNPGDFARYPAITAVHPGSVPEFRPR